MQCPSANSVAVTHRQNEHIVHGLVHTGPNSRAKPVQEQLEARERCPEEGLLGCGHCLPPDAHRQLSVTSQQICDIT